MSKHTPGPWTFGHWGDDFWVSPDSSGLTQKVARVTWGMGEEREEGRENARLIAAAPDLLEALKAISKRQYENRYTVHPGNAFESFRQLNAEVVAIYAEVDAAIAKAETTE